MITTALVQQRTMAVEPSSPGAAAPGTSRTGALRMLEPSLLLPPPGTVRAQTLRLPEGLVLLEPRLPAETEAITRSNSLRRTANPDADLTTQPRRWQTVASSAGLQPYTWGISGAVAARAAFGLQTTLFYTDNIDFQTNNITKSETVFEISPILKLDLGDPQGWISGSSSRLSRYYSSLLYIPTFYYRIDDEMDDYAQHFLGEIGRVSEVSRAVLRVDYDERIQASSDNTSPEENFTLLDASALLEYRLSPRTTLRGRAVYRQITVAQGGSSRDEWIGDGALLWELSPKTKIGLGAETGHLAFKQRALGTQDYEQALLLLEWKPTPKLGLTTRTGLEWRQFNRSPPRNDKVSLVTLSTFFWQATDKTRLNFRFGIANRPSVLAQGALFRELRFGPELLHDFSPNFYASAEFQVIRRRYDTGRLDWEPMSRLAFGWRQDSDKAFNRINIELFLQWHRRERNDIPNADLERTQAGVQLTRFF